MHAEIISIGTELTSGQNLDSNSQWLSQRLADIGISVGFHTTVSDNLDDNVNAFRIAAGRAGLIIATGGLGPTLDDLTREALARASGANLGFHQPSFDAIAEMFRQRNRPMPERNRVQAFFPEGAEPIPNSIQTAPGIWMRIGLCYVAALPGVPREMKPMYMEWVRPKLQAFGFANGIVVERRINVFGAGESHIEAMLGDLTQRGNVPEVGITASDATISLRIMIRAENEADALAQIAPTEAVIRERLGNLVYGTGDEELQDVLGQILKERNLTIATAESMTAGQVGERLARVPGAADWLKGGVVSYTNAVKSELLGVSDELLQSQGAVCASVAEAMAAGVRRLLGSDLAISTTGLAGPGDGGEGKPIGLAFVGLAWGGGTISQQLNWFGSRAEIQSRTAKSAINFARLWLQEHN